MEFADKNFTLARIVTYPRFSNLLQWFSTRCIYIYIYIPIQISIARKMKIREGEMLFDI